MSIKKQFLPEGHVLLGGGTEAVDPTLGAQQGSQLTGAFWASTSDYIRQDAITVFLEAPRAMEYMQNGAELQQFLKYLFEHHATALTGITRTIENEFAQTVVNNSGAQLETLIKSTETQSTPTYTWPEMRGKIVTKIMRDWSVMLGQNPYTKHPGIIAEPLYIDAGSPDLLQDDKTATLLIIEPQENLRAVQNAVLLTNIFPRTIPDEMSMGKGEALENLPLEIEFTALQQTFGIEQMANEYLESLNKLGYTTSAVPKYANEIMPVLQDEKTPNGYRPYVNSIAEALADG